jgi:hypothetical protein
VHAYGEPGLLGRKLVVRDVPPALLAERPAPLRAVYVLEAPGAAAMDPAAERRRLGETAAALALVRHTTAGGLLGGSEAPRVLERAAAVVRRVPAYALTIDRDFARLDEAVALLLRWHAPVALETHA